MALGLPRGKCACQKHDRPTRSIQEQFHPDRKRKSNAMTSLSHALRICVSAVLIRRMLLWVRKEKWACTPTSAGKGSCGSKCPPPFASPTLWTGLFQPPREELGSKPAHLPAVRRPFWIMGGFTQGSLQRPAVSQGGPFCGSPVFASSRTDR